MITAVILLRVDYARLTDIADEISKLNYVSEVFVVTGDEDLIVIVRGDSHEAIADVVTNKIAKVSGVTGCRTKIALRSFKQ